MSSYAAGAGSEAKRQPQNDVGRGWRRFQQTSIRHPSSADTVNALTQGGGGGRSMCHSESEPNPKLSKDDVMMRWHNLWGREDRRKIDAHGPAPQALRCLMSEVDQRGSGRIKEIRVGGRGSVVRSCRSSLGGGRSSSWVGDMSKTQQKNGKKGGRRKKKERKDGEYRGIQRCQGVNGGKGAIREPHATQESKWTQENGHTPKKQKEQSAPPNSSQLVHSSTPRHDNDKADLVPN
ncbi:hypothetical protein B0H34DRAFT_671835 [Crassisporium funariophilum]|nr:hypothetical protein B0H34DRAFT_671835 [Crassisporium funariophilum]